MKSSLRKKLRGFALQARGRRDLHPPPARHDELARAVQDMQDMRSCYDTLLSAAASTANSAYEFSESLRDMGTFLLEKTAMNDDEETGRILLLLGKTQFELQKLVDNYRNHINQTITTPSECLLKELQTAEEMKRLCDDKRDLYKFMLAAQREKGRSRNLKGESFSPQQLQEAQEAYDEEATLFVFRLKSLKQGLSRSLLTQAARHHAAQLSFFKKGVRSLEIVEPQVKAVAEQQHIDYHFTELEDNTDDDYDYDDGGYEDREQFFNYGQNVRGQDVSTSRNSMEENRDQSRADYLSFIQEPSSSSQSAPLFTDQKFEPSNRIKSLKPSPTKKFHTYVLPTPVDAKNVDLAGSGKLVSASGPIGRYDYPTKLWHSSPLESNKYTKEFRDEEESSLTRLLEAQSILREAKINGGPVKGSPPLAEFSLPQIDPHIASEHKKIQRHTDSVLLSNKASSKPMSSATSVSLSGVSSHGSPAKSPVAQKKSPGASPPLSSPKISELHQLPLPPVSSARGRRPGLIGHSAPLVPGGQDLYAASKMTSHKASPLPKPPGAMARSFSIPSSSQRTSELTVAKLLEKSHNPDITGDATSPTLTPRSPMVGNHQQLQKF
ncbi:hypothetical protein J5N97_022120 [Dioscorea zingiberensis]|uniref:Hydroxyproline-rich glycoprotein family protein n=1 Tax=Dioscorea zingiberensis TaxID=325984 RepID=A0A9D5HAP5_9LILI|nr:hypothetical protein J5N97_022120 [Dioscorea zingiberensis]